MPCGSLTWHTVLFAHGAQDSIGRLSDIAKVEAAKRDEAAWAARTLDDRNTQDAFLESTQVRARWARQRRACTGRARTDCVCPALCKSVAPCMMWAGSQRLPEALAQWSGYCLCLCLSCVCVHLCVRTCVH